MSGIVGAATRDGSPADSEQVRHLTEFLSFRGPDAQVVWSEQQAAFGHALLRITPDEIDERQPCSLDGRLWITAEARLDARAELLERLGNVGVKLSAKASDAQLILAAYREWGEQCLDYLAGDFAFALWDVDQQRLFCARDQFGVRPFFYAMLGTSLWLSNTLVCLRQHPKLGRTLDENWLGDWLVADMCGDAERTAFADIKRLPPAHCLRFDKSGLTIRRYWALPTEHPVLQLDAAEYVVEFQKLVREAIADRMPGKSVSVFMSGGLDSTLVAGFARQVAESRFGAADVHAHSMIYERLFEDEERNLARHAAAAMKISYHPMPMDDYKAFPGWDSNELRSAFDPQVIEVRGMQPEPFNYPLIQTLVEVRRRAVRNSRICMTGHGADPALAWPRDYFLRTAQSGRLFQFAREFLAYRRRFGKRPNFGLGRRIFGRRAPLTTFPIWLNPDFAKRLNLEERWRELNQPRAEMHQTRPEAHTYLSDHKGWGTLFESMDSGTMGMPISICHPLFDLRIITFFLSLPPFPWCVKKEILRQGSAGILPEEIRARPKCVFPGDPNVLAIQKLDPDTLDRYILPNVVDPYIERSAVISLEKLRKHDMSRMPWVHYRPYCFAYWIQQQPALLCNLKGTLTGSTTPRDKLQPQIPPRRKRIKRPKSLLTARLLN